MLRFQRLYYVNLHKTCVKLLNCKLCYQQPHLKYLCNLASYWLQAPWGWHDSVETFRSVIICEIFVHLWVIVQNNKTCQVHVLKEGYNNIYIYIWNILLKFHCNQISCLSLSNKHLCWNTICGAGRLSTV